MSHFSARNLALVAALLGGLPAVSAAQTDDQINQDNTPYGTTAAEFLLFGAGARGTALGTAFAAIATDVSALYYNPAGIALMPRAGAMVGTYDYVADTRYSWGGIAFPFSGGSRSVGIQVGTFGFKDQPVYTAEQPEGTGSVYSVSQTVAGITFAQNFSDRFSAGLTAKGVFDNLGEASGQAFAVDFGTNFHAQLSGHPIRFSFVVSNLGTNLSYSGSALETDAPRDSIPGEDPVPQNPQPSEFRTKDFPLPTIFRVGLAYDLIAGDNNRLTLLSDFNQPNNNAAGFSAGGEWATQRLGGSNFGFALRGSYSYAAANNLDPVDPATTALSDEENLQGLALGGGLNYGTGNFSIGVDYAWRYLGVLGSTNFFSVSLGW
ncbi:MAG TPA: PorV/PorQ family protein [Gemmatimonadales bacterium]